ncbi:MAG: hypothetical protein IK115_04050 [Lachnospiraceae bacterium]|nr:hypothetical protein [Lachnospiraceae bacterium]
MGKIAVLFPGVGYHKDRPLLYYNMRIAEEEGYQPLYLDFSKLRWEKKDLTDPQRMKELFAQAMEEVRAVLEEQEPGAADELLFISKSIGTVAANCYASEKQLKVKQIYFSPVVPFGSFVVSGGIAFCGDADPLADYPAVEEICGKMNIEMHRIRGGNHSLETGDTTKDLENLSGIMERVRAFLKEGAEA